MSDEKLRRLAREIRLLGLPLEDAFAHLAHELGLVNYRIKPVAVDPFALLDGSRKTVVPEEVFELDERKAFEISFETGQKTKFVVHLSPPGHIRYETVEKVSENLQRVFERTQPYNLPGENLPEP